jgi:GT2 family glycosyltransferase
VVIPFQEDCQGHGRLRPEFIREKRVQEVTDRASTFAIVLNFRTPDRTIRAVRSVQQSPIPADRIIVVDNASGDGSAGTLRESLPGIGLIVSETNGGFSWGCNLGIREALARGAARVLLVNSDAVVSPGAVSAMERALDADARLGIVGPLLVSYDNPDIIESAGISYDRFSGRMRHACSGARRSAAAVVDRRTVHGVSACAMLVTRAVFERVGLLAEEYFYGFEDLDLCLRAHAEGFGVACVAAAGAEVLHEGGASIGPVSARRIYFATRNHLLLASRCGGAAPALLRCLRPASILALNLAHALLTSRAPLREGLGAFARGTRDHFAGRYGAGPSAADI